MTGGASRNRLRGNRISGNGIVAQGNNFGIGLIAATDTENVIEENTIVGNTTGIFVAPGVQGNVFRRNLVVGNPPIQIAIDNSSDNFVDIRNLADDGANTFRENICLSSINAPCPAVGRGSSLPR
jgi:parallel beta-helix repeat protein